MKLLEVYYEHVKNEMVDFDKIDLVYEYNKLNDHIFNGELPLANSGAGDSATNSVQIRWNSGKNAHGRTSYSYKPDPNSGKIWTGKGWQTTNYKVVPGSIKVTMSKFLDVPYHVFLDTLAHEMIHGEQWRRRSRSRNDHDAFWQRAADRACAFHGFDRKTF